jgi:hypothetical protein
VIDDLSSYQTVTADGQPWVAVFASTVTVEKNPPLAHARKLLTQVNFMHCAESKSCANAGCARNEMKIPAAQMTAMRDIVRKPIMLFPIITPINSAN